MVILQVSPFYESRSGSFSGGRCGLLRGFVGEFRDDDPGSEVHDDTDAQGDEGHDHPDQPDDVRVDLEMFAKSPADPAEYPFLP